MSDAKPGSPSFQRKSSAKSASSSKESPRSPRKSSPGTSSRWTSPGTSSRRTSPGKSDKMVSPGRSKKGGATDQPPKSGKDRGRSSEKRRKATIKTPDTGITDDGLKRKDLSGEGLTVVPLNLLGERDLGEVNLNNNNLRNLPPEIKRWNTLQKLDISRNGIRCTRPDDFSGLPIEMKFLTSLEDLNISECNMPYIPPVVWFLKSLKFLDISRNKIDELPSKVGNLQNLQKINLKHTNIVGLPPEIAYCQELEEILLWGNSITSLPETLTEMPKLQTLALNYRSFTDTLDQQYMDNYLSTGQIKSEHIPQVVFELPTLRSLDLENTKINNLIDSFNISLQELNLSRNYLRELPLSVYNLHHLTLMDLSHNFVANLPSEIGDIRSLLKLRISHNLLKQLPDSIGKLQNLIELDVASNKLTTFPTSINKLRSLKTLIASDNQITYLLDEICELYELETLDVTANQIQALPMKLHSLTKLTCAHSFNKLHKHGLWLYKNPLVQPPPEVWRTDKPEAIFEYLKKLAIIKTENLQRQKMLVVGESQCGKTNFVWGLVHGKSLIAEHRSQIERRKLQKQLQNKRKSIRPVSRVKSSKTNSSDTSMDKDQISDHLQDFANIRFSDDSDSDSSEDGTSVGPPVTRFIEQTIWKTENAVEFVINDFGGDPNYTIGYPIFLDKKAMVMLVYDHSRYTEERHHVSVGQWLDLLNMYTPGAVVKLVGTKSDLCDSDYDSELTTEILQRNVQKQMQDHRIHLTEQLKAIKQEIQSLNSDTSCPSHKMAHLEAQKQKIDSLLDQPINVLDDVSIISTIEGLPGVGSLINKIELLAIDTSLFPHAQRCIPDHWNRFKVKLKQQKSYYLPFKEVKEIAKQFNIVEETLDECVKYLHDIGEVLWFHDIPGLSLILFHKPRILVGFITALYRHDYDTYLDYQENKIFMSKGNFNQETFSQSCDIFVRHGQISRPMLNSLWFYYDLDYDQFYELLLLLPMLDICYNVPEPLVPPGKNHCTPLLVLPWYSTDIAGQDLEKTWLETSPEGPGIETLTITYEFSSKMPSGVFERLASVLQEMVLTRIDWKDAIIGTTEEDKILIRLRSDNQNETQSLSITVSGHDLNRLLSFTGELTQVTSDILIRVPGFLWKIEAADKLWNQNIVKYSKKIKSNKH